MAIYLSMQMVRFSSTDGYENFKTVFSDVRNHLKTLPGFMHLTWWVHPDDPTWYNEVSFWAGKEALTDWHMNNLSQECQGVGCKIRCDHGRHHHELRTG
jgi:heme-degrading monooxygenase HmoA